MVVIDIRRSYEKCAEAGWYGYDFILKEPVTPEFIEYLGQLGDFIFLSALAKPFFKVETHDLIIKGICNNSEIRAAINNQEETNRLEELRSIINAYSDKK
jgi:hypothetical protein